MGGWGAAVGAVLTPGVGAAISPIPIIAVLLTLTGTGGVRTSTAFLAGYAGVLTVITAAALLLAVGSDVADASGPSLIASLVQLLIGVLFAYLAWTNWKKRPHAGESVETPAWMRSLETAGPAKTFRLGMLVSLVNVKNVSLAVAASAGIGQAAPSTAAAVVAGIVFVVLGCTSILVPLALAVFRPSSAGRLTSARTTLVANNALIMTVLFAVLSANSIGKALTALF